MNDSPPPMVVQLVGLLEQCVERVEKHPEAAAELTHGPLLLALGLAMALQGRYPVLTDKHTGTFPTEYAG